MKLRMTVLALVFAGLALTSVISASSAEEPDVGRELACDLRDSLLATLDLMEQSGQSTDEMVAEILEMELLCRGAESVDELDEEQRYEYEIFKESLNGKEPSWLERNKIFMRGDGWVVVSADIRYRRPLTVSDAYFTVLDLAPADEDESSKKKKKKKKQEKD